MRKSIASEYFRLCISLITAASLIVAAAMICFSVSTYKRDRQNQLEKEGYYARRATTEMIQSHNMDTEYLEQLYVTEQSHIEASFTLFDAAGDYVAGEKTMIGNTQSRLGAQSMEAADNARSSGSFDISTMGGLFDSPRVCLLHKISDGGRTYYMLSFMSADGLYAYLRNMVMVFVSIFALILICMYPMLRYAVDRIIKPVREMTLAAKRFGEGDFSEKVSIADHSEMGFLAKTLNEMAYALESIEENRKSFVSNVSHELRTPMTTIGGFVDGILDGTIPESRHREYLTIVSEEINRLARLVRSMLNISKYEAGEMELQTEDFDLTALTIKTVLLFEKRIEDKGIDIQGLDADRFYVNADMDLTQQVIYNLTENAVKFVNKEGFISYSFGCSEGFVTVTVRNSGEGLRKNEIHRVFDRFYKTDESRGKDKTGVGLGLSIVRSIIKLHGGTVTVRSKPGEYTEFEFTLPIGSAPARREN
ncbi:MAG: HAMP domain-containing histidine kinase [Oscillospiraceae bacterium]|nr:HAMP domain-containing histidine kinase [Oscillospiraceae bacterium]